LLCALAACGQKETMASKSAAAYREAQAEAVPVAVVHDHAQHTATSHMDHSTMTSMDHATMTHADHATMVDHSTMTDMEHSAAAHSGHTAAPDHAAMPGMHQHATPAAATTVTVAPRSTPDIHRIDPAATLSADEFDAPAPTSVEEARKAAGGGKEQR
jgi:uncharacterized protein GlcG (DUF336 family)